MKKYYIKPDPEGRVFVFNRLWGRKVFASIIALTLVMYQVVEAEWHQFHGDATNRGFAELGPGIAYFSTPRFVVGDSLIAPSSPCVMNGRIFVYGAANDSGFIQSFDEKTGDSLWATPIAPPALGSWSSPSADPISNSVYIGSSGTLYRIDANSGNIIWEGHPPEYGFVDASPTINIDDSLVYMNTYGSFAASTYLCAFKISNGDVLWSNFLWGQGQGAPAYDANRSRVYFPLNVLHQWTSPGKIAAFDAVTGDTIWISDSTHNCACFGSATYDSISGTVMVGGWNGSMLIVNADDGSFVVEASVVSGGDYTPVIGSTYVYVTGDGGTQAIDHTTGNTVWHTSGTGSWCSAVCYAEDDGTGRDVVYDGGDGLYMLDADDGTILATYGNTGTGTPALANGNVYFIQRPSGKIADGRLVALGPVPFISVQELVDISREGFLSQNYPNPFNSNTIISLGVRVQLSGVSKGQKVSLKIYNLSGRLVKSFPITNDQLSMTSIVWDGNDSHNNPVASGFYIYKLETEHFSKARKMLILR